MSSEGADDQLAALQDIAASRGWAVVATIADQPSTGTISARSDRPSLEALLHIAAHRPFNTLVVWSLSDLASTLPALIRAVNELRGHGIDLLACDDRIDTTVPAGKAAFTAFAAIAGFEREQIKSTRQAIGERGIAMAENPLDVLRTHNDRNSWLHPGVTTIRADIEELVFKLEKRGGEKSNRRCDKALHPLIGGVGGAERAGGAGLRRFVVTTFGVLASVSQHALGVS
ncbi:MAG: recombinase family protein [Steroidobacteraceae bacterium]